MTIPPIWVMPPGSIVRPVAAENKKIKIMGKITEIKPHRAEICLSPGYFRVFPKLITRNRWINFTDSIGSGSDNINIKCLCHCYYDVLPPVAPK